MGTGRKILGAFTAVGILSLSAAHLGGAGTIGRAEAARVARTPAKPIAIKVYKTPTCGCCKAWVQHLRDNGFKVETMDMPDLSLIKQKYGVPQKLQSCHTAVVNGYVVEGHVPADVIVKMLKEHPAIAGVTVPGMVTGSPGMEGASKPPYDVLTFDPAGHSRVYAKR